jgi:hypothetical protein
MAPPADVARTEEKIGDACTGPGRPNPNRDHAAGTGASRGNRQMNGEATTIPESIEIDLNEVVNEFEAKSWRERVEIFDLYLDDVASAFLARGK